MPLIGCNKADGAVAVFTVVPAYEGQHPLAGSLQAFEGLIRIGRCVFQGTKQRF